MIIKKKNISFIMTAFFCSLLFGGCGIDKSGVEITSKPIAKVYINGKESGTTPYKNNTLKPGDIYLKLDDNKGNFWERKIKLENNVTSVINWNFDDNRNTGYILSMEKTGGNGSILVNSNPDGAMIYLDGEARNNSPSKIESVEDGDKKLSINYPGYKTINLIIKVVKGYQLIVDAKLEKEVRADTGVTITPIPTSILGPKIRIKETETGWLRIRDAANNNGIEIGKAKPGDVYELISENNGWYQIKFGGKNGWVSTKYAEKISG
ncbi:MAG: PEGA domain-containing protein [Candidatus Shapirobacteria bacterium]